MLTIPVAALRLQKAVVETEEAVDAAVLKATALITEVVIARGEHRTHEAAPLAQPALLRLQKALADLNSAQGEVARAHGSLRDAQRITATPFERECPPSAELGDDDSRWQVV